MPRSSFETLAKKRSWDLYSEEMLSPEQWSGSHGSHASSAAVTAIQNRSDADAGPALVLVVNKRSAFSLNDANAVCGLLSDLLETRYDPASGVYVKRKPEAFGRVWTTAEDQHRLTAVRNGVLPPRLLVVTGPCHTDRPACVVMVPSLKVSHACSVLLCVCHHACSGTDRTHSQVDTLTGRQRRNFDSRALMSGPRTGSKVSRSRCLSPRPALLHPRPRAAAALRGVAGLAPVPWMAMPWMAATTWLETVRAAVALPGILMKVFC